MSEGAAVDAFLAILAADIAQRDHALAAGQITRQEYRRAAATDVASISRYLSLMNPPEAERSRLIDFIKAKLAAWAWGPPPLKRQAGPPRL